MEMENKKTLFDEAREQTLETLLDFMRSILIEKTHTYESIVDAIAACAIGAAWAADNSPEGGITGWQANFVMWSFIKEWMYRNNKCGLKIVDYDDMLFPQYSDHFKKTISKSVWEALQKEAKEQLKISGNTAHPVVVAHWKSIVNGEVPFGYRVKEER